MPLISPDATNALAAGFQGQDLAAKLLQQQLMNRQRQQAMQDEEKQRQAKALIGQVMSGLIQQRGQTPPTSLPQQPGAIMPQQPSGNGSPAPAPGGAAAMPGGPSPLPGRPGAALSTPEADAFSWGDVLDALRAKTGADPQVIADAVMQVMPELDKESARKDRAATARMNYDAKIYNTIETLKWRYANTNSQTERTQIMADIKKQEAQLRSGTAIEVAKIGAASREQVAETGAESREAVQQSRADVDRDKIALRKELGNAALDVKADDIAKTFLYRERVLDLREKGMTLADAQKTAQRQLERAIFEIKDTTVRRGQDLASADRIAALKVKQELGDKTLALRYEDIQNTKTYRDRMLDLREKGLDYQHADTQAKLEVQRAVAQMRDEATRRGQDLVHEDRVAAEAGRQSRFDTKTAIVQRKAAIGLDDALAKSDDLVKDAENLLLDPNLDKSVGARVTHLPGFMSQDVTNFRSKLDSFKAEKMMALVQQLRGTGNGSTGFGRITNFEAQALQNSIASLRDDQDPPQFRAALHKLIDQVSAAKSRLAAAYEQEYGGQKAAGTGGKGVPTGSAGASIATPKEVQNEPDGTVFEMDGKQYKKQGGQSVQVK